MPFGPAKSERVSRSRNWAMLPALADDLGRAFFWSGGVAARVGVLARRRRLPVLGAGT